MHRILIVDDDRETCRFMAELLEQPGRQFEAAYDPDTALRLARSKAFDLVISDINLNASVSGLDVLRAFKDANPGGAVVLISGFGTLETAIDAVRAGAFDYISKPFNIGEVKAIVERALKQQSAPAVEASLPARPPSVPGLIGRTAGMLEVYKQIARAADAAAPVLIVGESGTGKELVARSIHQRSQFANGPFIAVHTGAIPQDLIASELFGHEKGAFTGAVDKKPGKFELAEGGTLFLDEISTMDERTQINLLRVLETHAYTRVGGKKEREAKVRVLAASNRDLEAMVKAGEFREDLYYRLNIFAVKLPPLRERSEDIPVIAGEYVREFAQKYGKTVASIPAETQRLLVNYNWPGNVRELRNVVEQAVLLARDSELAPSLLPQMLHRGPLREDIIKIPIGTAMDDIEREVILRTLAANAGNKTATAEVLGISRRSIYNKLALYGVATNEEDDRDNAEH